MSDIRPNGESGVRRVLCPLCGKRVALTKAGTYRKHSTYARTCPNSGSEHRIVHMLEIEQDFAEGWYFGICSCGAQQGPFPDAEDVADWYGDHREAAALAGPK